MKLSDLFMGLKTVSCSNWDESCVVSNIQKDSRLVGQGDLFVACRGAKQDGHDYISEVIKRGVSAIVYEKEEIQIPETVIGIRVSDTQLVFSELLKRWNNFSDEAISILGVTGTNGKTTVSQLLYRLLSTRFKAGTIGTLSYELPSGTRESGNTTPGTETLIPLLSEMVSQGARYVSMEVSSHALEQRRVCGLRFELAIFTQLTQDHLDYHGDLETYFQAKRRLFTEYQPKHMLINRDCPYGRRLLQEFPSAKSFSIEGPADYQAIQIQELLSGSRFGLAYRGKVESFSTQLPLHYNVSNCTAVLAGLDLLGLDIREFTETLAQIPFIPGRMERVPHPSVHIFVDYAHTPDAFFQVLRHVQLQKPKKIITVFGCGGDRDRGKRPKMTRVAADFSDILILTSDNPRTEDPKVILQEMKTALTEDDSKRVQIFEDLDRARAIDRAVDMAQPGDAVLILGKGHEDYQIIGTKKNHFSDRETVLEALSRSGSGLCPTAASSFDPQRTAIAPFSIDTRTLKPGEFFIALDGQNQKGYVFLPEAFKKGASAALCAKSYQTEVQSLLPAELYAKVTFAENPALTMAEWAHVHRMRFSIPVIGIAGSVGKTSTKQFLAYLLSQKKNILATTGNLNNHLGLPMMMSRLNSGHDAAVFEMGADHVGDLKKLVFMAEPTIGVLTPIAPEHLQGFGSLAGVYDGELELLLSPRIQTLITVEGDVELDRRIKNWKGKVVRVGFSDSADVRISDLRVENNRTHFHIQGMPVILPTPASFLAINASLAAATALELGCDKNALMGEWNPEMPEGRFSIRKMARDLTVIDDTYNSSPKAFAAALEAFDQMSFPRKWLVFSDMLELGNESEFWHQDLGRKIARADLHAAYAFGPNSLLTIEALRKENTKVQGAWFENAKNLAEKLAAQIQPGDAVLFKGSRGMKVEQVLELLDLKFSIKTAL